LIEKKEVIGPKICAGGLTVLDYEFIKPIKTKLCFENQHIYLNNRTYIIRLQNPIYTIERKILGQHQLSLLKKYNNVTIHTNAELKSIDKDSIVIKYGNKEKKVFYKHLIGADGSTSVVRGYLGLKSEIYMGIQYIIPKTYDKLIWILNPELLGSGYGWIFPHEEFTSAGIFYNPRKMTAVHAKEVLDILLMKYKIDFLGARFEGAPTNTFFKGFEFGNIFLIGDAAGLVSANTGEGISYALTSGEDVAKHILNNTYNFDKIRDILKYKNRQERILKIFDIMHFAWIQNLLFHIFIQLLNHEWFQQYYGD